MFEFEHRCARAPEDDATSLALPRRAFVATSIGSVLGFLLARRAAFAATEGEPRERKSPARAVIILWLSGGPSHVDTFDPKRHAGAGPFRHIDTAIKGARFTEHLPRTAEIADRLAVIRSITSKELNHFRARYLMKTGYDQDPTVRHPAFGCVLSKFRGDASDPLPQFVTVNGQSVGPGFLGDLHAAFCVRQAGEPIESLAPAPGVSMERFDRRMALLDAVEKESPSGVAASPEAETLRALQRRTIAFMRSPKTSVFDLAGEPAELKRAYGENAFGRGCLLARRLVENGVKCVEVTLAGFDTHTDTFSTYANLLSILDPAFTALVRDLETRGLLDSTLVLTMGEFGRTPDIAPNDGRHHHGGAFSAVLAGGGVRGGLVHGVSDERGDKVVKDPVTIPDVIATLCDRLGIDPETPQKTPGGRPVMVAQGKPIRAILEDV